VRARQIVEEEVGEEEEYVKDFAARHRPVGTGDEGALFSVGDYVDVTPGPDDEDDEEEDGVAKPYRGRITGIWPEHHLVDVKHPSGEIARQWIYQISHLPSR
jgi:hypothetical protein